MAFQSPDNITNITSLLHNASVATDGWLGAGIAILMTIIIFFISLERFPTPQAFTGAILTGMITSFFLKLLGLVSGFIPFLFIIGAILSYLWMKSTEPSFG